MIDHWTVLSWDGQKNTSSSTSSIPGCHPPSHQYDKPLFVCFCITQNNPDAQRLVLTHLFQLIRVYATLSSCHQNFEFLLCFQYCFIVASSFHSLQELHHQQVGHMLLSWTFPLLVVLGKQGCGQMDGHPVQPLRTRETFGSEDCAPVGQVVEEGLPHNQTLFIHHWLGSLKAEAWAHICTMSLPSWIKNSKEERGLVYPPDQHNEKASSISCALSKGVLGSIKDEMFKTRIKWCLGPVNWAEHSAVFLQLVC